MRPLTALALVAALAAGCAHKPMTNQQLARSATAVGAAVIITSAIVYAEYRSATPPNLGPTTSALPPK